MLSDTNFIYNLNWMNVYMCMSGWQTLTISMYVKVTLIIYVCVRMTDSIIIFVG